MAHVVRHTFVKEDVWTDYLLLQICTRLATTVPLRFKIAQSL